MAEPTETQRNFIRSFGRENNLDWAVKGFQPADRTLESVNDQALRNYIEQQAARSGIYGGATHAPPPPNTSALDSIYGGRLPINAARPATQPLYNAPIGPPEAAGPRLPRPTAPGWSAMRATPAPTSSFPNLGARMANPGAFETAAQAAQAAPKTAGAMADLQAIGGTLGNALRGAGRVAGAVASNPVVNNPLTRTAARGAGLLGVAAMPVAAWNEMADPTSRASQHNALYDQAMREGHYGDAAYEGAMSVANTVGAATGLRDVYDYFHGEPAAAVSAPAPAAAPAAPARAFDASRDWPAMPTSAVRPQPHQAQPQPQAARQYDWREVAPGRWHLGEDQPQQARQAQPQGAIAGGPANSMVANPMYYGDDPRLPIELRYKLAGMSPKPHYTSASEDATARGVKLAEALYAARQRTAGNDPTKALANADELRKAYLAFGQSGKGYAPMYGMTPLQPTEPELYP